jgi:hypothetical protein
LQLIFLLAPVDLRKKCHCLADRLIHERDARLEEAGKRIATLEELLSQLANATCAYDTKEAAKRAAIRFAKSRVPQIIREASMSPDDRIRKAARAIGTPFETFKAHVLASAELRERFGLPVLAA